jgi:hypothetical protein
MLTGAMRPTRMPTSPLNMAGTELITQAYCGHRVLQSTACESLHMHYLMTHP